MDNQPKKYRNFIVGAASAALIASAVAPVASAATKEFPDVKGNTHETSINALVAQGIIGGYPDGTFKPNKTLSRSDVVKMMGKWLQNMGYEVPSDYKTNPRFKDLTSKTNEELLKSAALVKDNGVFGGYENGTLGAANDITRENMAMVLVRAYDAVYKTDLVNLVKEDEFTKEVTDLAAAKAEARPYIDVLDYFDITHTADGKFMPKSTTTRGQFATFLYKASNVKVEDKTDKEAPKLVYNGEKTLNVKYGETFTMPTVTATDNTDETVEVTSVITNEAGERVTAIDTKTSGTYKVTYSAVDKAGNHAEDLVVTVVVGENPNLEVASVTSENAKELVVTFNNPIETGSVMTDGKLKSGVITLTRTSNESGAGILNGDLKGKTATLSKDGKVLTVLAPSTEFFKGNYDVKVSGVVKKDTVKPMENFYGKFTANDTKAPAVTGVTYNPANDKIEVTLSKPIDQLTGQVLRVNGQPVEFEAIEGPTNKLTFKRPETVAAGTSATLYIAGLRDAAGNLLDAYNGSVSITQDATALSVGNIEQVSNDTVRVTFNKALDKQSNINILAQKGLVVTKSNGQVTNTYTVTKAPAAVNPDGTKYDITFGDATFANGTTENFTVTFTDKAFTGVSGTANALTTKNVTLVKDTTAPAVQSVKQSLDGKAIEVTMTKNISVADAAKVKLRKDNVELTGTNVSVKNGNILVISMASNSQLATGSYTVRLEAGAIKDTNGNLNAVAMTSPVAVDNTTAVQPQEAVIANMAGDQNVNIFTVTAPNGEKFVAQNVGLSHFTLDGQALPVGSDVSIDANHKVITVKLPAKDSITTSGPATLTAKDLTYASGKPFATTTATVTVTDNTPATLTSARVTGNSIELTFDENIKADAFGNDIAKVLQDLTITSDTATFEVGNATASTSVNGKKVIINVVPGTSNYEQVVAGNNLKVSTNNTVTNLTDANGVLVKASVSVPVTK